MTSFGVAALGWSAASLAISDGAGGNSAATLTGTWTSFGFAVSLATLSAPASTRLGPVFFSMAGCAPATLTGTAGFARTEAATDATVAVAAGAASSSSSSR